MCLCASVCRKHVYSVNVVIRDSPQQRAMLCPPTGGRSMADHSTEGLVSRRDVLKRVGIAGAAAAVPIDAIAQATREPFETLTAAEGATLEAIVARLIPTDANGPGAAEARAARYIDRALGGFLTSSRDAYRTGLAGIETYSRAAKGMAFTQLTAQEQDAVLTDMERNSAKGFDGASFFFNLVLSHTIQGTFGDPFYGGN